jgi:phosphoglycolate phosphatase-like HAD superfamily hydrolase
MAAQLSLWNEGAVKNAIITFVTRVTAKGSPTFVPPAERIATFDNDGTLWLEKPMYIQLQHGLHAIGKAATEKPELRDRQPFKAVYEKDMAWLGKVAADYAKGDPRGVFELVAGLAEVFDGATVEAFEADVLEFLSSAQDARFKKSYKQLTYKPMVELIHYLQDNGFQVHITSGGGRDFMRAVCEEIYGIPRSMVIGSSVTRILRASHRWSAPGRSNSPSMMDPANRRTSIVLLVGVRSWRRVIPMATFTCFNMPGGTKVYPWLYWCITTMRNASTPTKTALIKQSGWPQKQVGQSSV